MLLYLIVVMVGVCVCVSVAACGADIGVVVGVVGVWGSCCRCVLFC